MTIKHTVRTDRRARGSLSGASVEYQRGIECAVNGSQLPANSSRTFRSGYNKGQGQVVQFETSLQKARKTQAVQMRKLAYERAYELYGKEFFQQMKRTDQKIIINQLVQKASMH